MKFFIDYRFANYKLLCLSIAFLLIGSTSQGQSFRFQANVDAVHQSGFHRILLSPNVVGYLNANLTDIRIYDNQQHEIPYRLIQQQPMQAIPFVDYELVSKQSIPNVTTTLIVRNRAKNRINSLGIVIRNTNVGKKARLSGSSDAQTWYAIDDAIWLEPTGPTATTTETKQIDFPLSDYEYYRLDVNDSLSTPLNILRIGHYRPIISSGAYTAIPGLTVSQRDSSDKRSYIHLTRLTDARFDKLAISIQASASFRRRAELGQFRTQKRKRGRIDRWFGVVRSFELSSSDSSIVYLPGLKTNDLYLVITNDDNPPLRVRDVRAYQLTTYLLANLTTGKPYQLRFSANDAVAPTYDMTPFKASLVANSPVVDVGEVVSTNANDMQSASFFTDRRIIWPALGLVLLMLGILSYRMLREIGKANNQLE